MITSPRVFDDERLPRALPHRESEVESITRSWDPITNNEPGEDVLLSGPSGVGKTALVRYGLQCLRKKTTVKSPHVHCLGQTAGDILRSILEDLGEDPPGNRPVEDLQRALQDVVDESVIVILDEADGLPENAALEVLAHLRQLSLVAITHDPDRWLTEAPRGVRRRFTGVGGEELTLDRYGDAEIVDILQPRADQGLRPNVVTREQLQSIAAEAGGIARVGIQSLRAAAALAGERGHDRIREPDIADCFERARHRIRQRNLQSLPFHHHVLYAIIRDAGEIDGTALHDRYEAVAPAVYEGAPKTSLKKRNRRNILSKLVDYDLVIAEAYGPNRTYVVVDPAIESSVDLEVGEFSPK